MLSLLQKQRGFTLIELLVVMAVLSILIGIGVNTFTIAQKKARDTKRKADIRTIQTVLEAYRANNGVYPASQSQCGPTDYEGLPNSLGSRTQTNNGQDVLVPTYLPSLPTDPIGGDCWSGDNVAGGHGSNVYSYDYLSDGNTYILTARLEDPNDPQTCSGSRCNHPSFSGDRIYMVRGE